MVLEIKETSQSKGKMITINSNDAIIVPAHYHYAVRKVEVDPNTNVNAGCYSLFVGMDTDEYEEHVKQEKDDDNNILPTVFSASISKNEGVLRFPNDLDHRSKKDDESEASRRLCVYCPSLEGEEGVVDGCEHCKNFFSFCKKSYIDVVKQAIKYIDVNYAVKPRAVKKFILKVMKDALEDALEEFSLDLEYYDYGLGLSIFFYITLCSSYTLVSSSSTKRSRGRR